MMLAPNILGGCLWNNIEHYYDLTLTPWGYSYYPEIAGISLAVAISEQTLFIFMMNIYFETNQLE